MFGLKWINWFRHRRAPEDSHALDPLVRRALDFLAADPQAALAPDSLVSRLMQEEVTRHAWQEGGHWAEGVCRSAAAAALRLHAAALAGDE